MDEKEKLEIQEIKERLKYFLEEKKYEEGLALCTSDFCKYLEGTTYKIRFLFLMKKYEEIIPICNEAYLKWRDSYFLQSRYVAQSSLVKIFIVQGEYEKAFPYLSEYDCNQNDILLGYKITILKRLNRLEEALALCPSFSSKSNLHLEKKKISILFALERYEEIIKECLVVLGTFKVDYFVYAKNTAVSHIVKEKNRQGDYEGAFFLFCKEFCVEKNQDLVYSIIKELENKGKIKEALKYCTETLCKTVKFFCTQRIYFLFLLENYEEILKETRQAYQIWRDDCFLQSHDTAISHLMKRLLNEGKEKEALIFYEQHLGKFNMVLETQRICILFVLEKYEAILAICEENLEIWPEEDFFIEKRRMAEKYLNQERNRKSEILTRIYFNTITVQEIESLNSTVFQEILLKLAYYEKNFKSGQQKGLKLIKQRLFGDFFNEEEKRILENLKNKFICQSYSKKSKNVDWKYYCQVLHCSIKKYEEDKEICLERKKDKLMSRKGNNL